MLPILRLLGDGAEHRASQATDELSDVFGLTPEERQEPLASGSQPRIRNKVGWACTYLKKAGLIESPARGVYTLTPRGRSVLNIRPRTDRLKYLERFPEYVASRDLRHERAETKLPEQESVGTTPEEALDAGVSAAAGRPGAGDPRPGQGGIGGLLRAPGRGVAGAVWATAARCAMPVRPWGRSGDGGIDGIIKEDRLGLDVI